MSVGEAKPLNSLSVTVPYFIEIIPAAGAEILWPYCWCEKLLFWAASVKLLLGVNHACYGLALTSYPAKFKICGLSSFGEDLCLSVYF